MVSGAYTLTDTMRGAADSLSSSAYDGTAAVVSAKTAFKVDDELRGSSADSSVDARAGPRRTRRREGRRQHHRRGPDRGQGRRRRRHRPVLRRRARPARRQADPVQAEGGPLRLRSRRGRDRRRHRRPRGLFGRRHDRRSRPAGPSASSRSAASPRSATSTRSARPRSRCSTSHAAQTLFHKQGSYTEILVGGPDSVRKQLSESLAQLAQRPDGGRPRPLHARRAEEFVKFLKVFLLVFGGIAVVRGRVHDLQHALDHGRAALA